MIEIGFGFVDRGNRVALRHGTSSQAFELWKDEPHPMTALGAATYLGERAGIDFFLRFDEAMQPVSARHSASAPWAGGWP